MQKCATFLFLVLLSGSLTGLHAQASKKASANQQLSKGLDITFDYGSPGVKGRKIWGDLVPFGLAPGNQYSDNKPFPWRAGANENTTMAINKDVKIDGKSLPAGKYSIHMIPSKEEWIVIFNKNSNLWGSYKYSEEEDALRVTVTPMKAEHMEWLTFGFEEVSDKSTVAFLHWEELKVPFTVELAE